MVDCSFNQRLQCSFRALRFWKQDDDIDKDGGAVIVMTIADIGDVLPRCQTLLRPVSFHFALFFFLRNVRVYLMEYLLLS